MELAATLGRELAPRELVGLLDKNKANQYLHGNPNSQALAVYSAILQAKLIPTFSSNDAVFTALVGFMSTPAGVGCLTSYLNTCSSAECSSLVRVLEHILRTTGVLGTLLAESPVETAKLVFGSRILNAVAARTNESWAGSPERYSQWLSKQFIQCQLVDPKLTDRALKLGAPRWFVKPLLLENPVLLKRNLNELRSKRFAVLHGIVPLLPKSPGKSAKMLLDLDVDVDTLTSICLQLADTALSRALVVLAKCQNKLVHIMTPLLREWSSKLYVQKTPLAEQQHLTQLLVACTASLSPSEAKRVSLSSDLTAGVQNRLVSTSQSMRNLGTLLGEVLAKQAGAKLEFGIQYTDYSWWIGVDEIDPTYQYTDTETFEPEADSPGTVPAHLESVLNPKPPADSDDEDNVYGDDADSDEEVTPPYYLKDLVEYLRSDKYGEVLEALTVGAELIRRKATFGTEVPQYADDLLRSAVALTDKYSITKFSELRQSLIDAIVIADPSQATKVIHMFATGDWSLSQRQSLLAALVNAAHTLASGGSDVQTEQLPDRIHRMFIGDSTPAAVGPGESVASALESGTVTRRSHRLDPGERTTGLKKNLFSKISFTFFYPLLAAKPPLRPVSYDSIVFAQWLRTLGVIIAEAYPGSEVPGMVQEMWLLLKDILAAKHNESVILESIFADISILVEVGAAIILQSFASEIGMVFDLVLAAIDESSGEITAQTVQLGRSAASQLAKLLQTISNTP